MNYPLLFTYRDLVKGNGFLAAVEGYGRLLLAVEDGGVWMYGVDPGGLSGFGENADEALIDFRGRYRAILFDVAAASPDFNAFEASVRGLFADTNRPNEVDWKLALNAVREKDLTIPGLEKKPAHEPVVLVNRVPLSSNSTEPIFAAGQSKEQTSLAVLQKAA